MTYDAVSRDIESLIVIEINIFRLLDSQSHTLLAWPQLSSQKKAESRSSAISTT